MDTENVRSRIQTFHNSILGRNLDSKTLNYIVNRIQLKQLTVDDYEHGLLRGEDYVNFITKRFRESYMDLIGFDISEEDFKRFCDAFVGQIVSESAIFKYVVSLPQFDEKYISVINNLFMLTKKEACGIAVLNFYLSLFKSNPTYNVDMLADDIKRDLHIVDATTQKEAVSGYAPTAVPAISDQDANYIRFAKTFENEIGGLPVDLGMWLKERLCKKDEASKMKMKKDTMHAFEQVYKRPMFVEEYFKYAVDNHVADFQHVHSMHNGNFNRMRELYEAYTMKHMSEHEYVKNYLYEVDNAAFFDNIVDEIVSSESYAECMKAAVAQKYKQLYDEELDSNDIVYIFGIVKERKLSHVDGALSQLLVEIKKATDEIISHIFKQFSAVLERHPDVYEIDTYVAYYRERQPEALSTIDIQLEGILMHSLEFHDIMKKRIKSQYVSIKKRDILPSIVFSTLNKLLEMIDACTMDNIDDRISALLH